MDEQSKLHSLIERLGGNLNLDYSGSMGELVDAKKKKDGEKSTVTAEEKAEAARRARGPLDYEKSMNTASFHEQQKAKIKARQKNIDAQTAHALEMEHIRINRSPIDRMAHSLGKMGQAVLDARRKKGGK